VELEADLAGGADRVVFRPDPSRSSYTAPAANGPNDSIAPPGHLICTASTLEAAPSPT
jgi:hypothetical protein